MLICHLAADGTVLAATSLESKTVLTYSSESLDMIKRGFPEADIIKEIAE